MDTEAGAFSPPFNHQIEDRSFVLRQKLQGTAQQITFDGKPQLLEEIHFKPKSRLKSEFYQQE